MFVLWEMSVAECSSRWQARVSSRLKLLPIFSNMSELSLHRIVSADLFQFVRCTFQEVLFREVRAALRHPHH